MSPIACRVRRAGVLGILALTAAAACGGDPAPAGTPISEPSPTEAPAASTTAPEPLATVTEAPAVSTTAPEPPAAVDAFDIGEDTALREAFEAFAGSEQACVRDALGSDQMESVLDTLVLSEGDIDQSMAPILQCLAPETAREFYLSAVMAGLTAGLEAEGLTTEVGDHERACVRQRLADADVADMIDAVDSEADSLGLLGCFPNLFVEALLSVAGVPLDDLTEQQRSCLDDWAASIDWTAMETDEAYSDSEALALFACVPDLMSAGASLDPAPREDMADDHADSSERATPVAVGEVAQGELQYDDDVDYFVFEAEQGRLYQIDVALGTLDDSVATLYGPDGAQLESNDDHADTLASRISWEAPSSGRHYLAVEGFFSTGSYTVTITAG